MAEKASRRVVIVDGSVNNYGFRMLPEGGDFEQYKRNNILLFMHNRPFRGNKDDILAIGNVENVELVNGRWEGDLVFDQTDDFAKQIELKWDAGVYKMVSLGADPKEFSDDAQYLLPGQTRSTVTKWKADEVSVIDIGGNDNSIVLYNDGKMIKLGSNEDNDFVPILKTETESLDLEINNTEMKSVAIKLGLAESATESEILEKIASLQNDAKVAGEMKAEVEKIKLAGITHAVETAITEKRITADKKEQFITLGKTAGIEMLNSTLGVIPVASKPTDHIELGKGEGAPNTAKKFYEFNEKDLIQLRKENKAEYIRLYKAEFGVEPAAWED